MELHAHKKARQGAENSGKALRKRARRCALQKQATLFKKGCSYPEMAHT